MIRIEYKKDKTFYDLHNMYKWLIENVFDENWYVLIYGDNSKTVELTKEEIDFEYKNNLGEITEYLNLYGTKTIENNDNRVYSFNFEKEEFATLFKLTCG